MSKIKILFVGESWFVQTIEFKGYDNFVIGGYQTEIDRVKKYFADDRFELIHMPAHVALESFPETIEELRQYDIVMVSDVGANTFLLHPKTFFGLQQTPNKLSLIRDYVAEGGAFGMIGGYMSFMGIEAKANYRGTAIEEILPITMYPHDDRIETPEGIYVNLDPQSHPVLKGMKADMPPLLGYNKLMAKEDAEVLITVGDENDPMLALGEYGKGRTFAFATDCAPHWMPEAFCDSPENHTMWQNVTLWATKNI